MLGFFYLFEIDLELGFENGSGTYTLPPVFYLFIWPRPVSLVHELEMYKLPVNSMSSGGDTWRFWFYFKKFSFFHQGTDKTCILYLHVYNQTHTTCTQGSI